MTKSIKWHSLGVYTVLTYIHIELKFADYSEPLFAHNVQWYQEIVAPLGHLHFRFPSFYNS